MTQSARETFDGAPRPQKKTCGVTGMILALMGMVCAIAGPSMVEELYPPSKIDYAEAADKASDFIADVAVKTGRKISDAIWNRVKKPFSRADEGKGGSEALPKSVETAESTEIAELAGAAPTAPAVSRRERMSSLFRFAGMGGGISALFLGFVGWVKGEDHRAAVAASVMGLIAMAWLQIIVALALIAFAVIAASVFR